MPKILIELSQGKFAVVDEADYTWLMTWKWTYHSGGYAYRQEGPKKRRVTVLMHRFICEPPDGLEVDHINRNRLDNRRENLRIATRAENAVNRGLLPSNKTGFKGVHKPIERRTGTRWPAVATLNDEKVDLGLFESAEKAALAVDHFNRKHFGEFAVLNFPELHLENAPSSVGHPPANGLPYLGSAARNAYEFLKSRVGQRFTLTELSSMLPDIPRTHLKVYFAKLARNGHIQRAKTDGVRYFYADVLNSVQESA